MHEIRLAGPWDVKEHPESDWKRTQLPYSCHFDHGEVQLRRKFHRPTGLDSTSRVRLEIDATIECGVSINGDPVSRMEVSGATVIDVTKQLSQFNELVLTVQPSIIALCIMRGVKLQIMEDAEPL